MIELIDKVKDNDLIEELRNLELKRDMLQQQISSQQSEMDQAKANQKTTGEFADPDWFAKNKISIRDGSTELHNINRRIKEIKSNINKSNPSAVFFQRAAKKILNPILYEEILKSAEECIKNR